MEMTVATVIIVVMVVWYFGSSINSITSGASDMASREFATYGNDQRVRLHKRRISQTKELDDIKDQNVYSDDEFEAIFDVIGEGKSNGKNI